MKLILTPPKPRNPFASAARLRHAGAHRRGSTSQRQRGARELRIELARASP